MGLKVQIKNENDSIEKSTEIVLVNYYGSVLKYIDKFKLIFFGKSLLKKLEKDGGQNPIDAAKLGCNIFHGPYVSNFQEIYDYLDNEKISEKINDHKSLAEKLINNFDNTNYIASEKSEKLKDYSNEIFKKVINEYERFIK